MLTLPRRRSDEHAARALERRRRRPCRAARRCRRTSRCRPSRDRHHRHDRRHDLDVDGPAAGPHRDAGVHVVGPVRQAAQHAAGVGGVDRLAEDLAVERRRWCRPRPRHRPVTPATAAAFSPGQALHVAAADPRPGGASRRCRAAMAAKRRPSVLEQLPAAGRSRRQDQAGAGSLIDSRSRPLGPFARSARSSISAPGRSGHSLAPLAHRSPLPAARAIRSLRSLIDPRSRPLGPFARSARSSARHQRVGLRGQGRRVVEVVEEAVGQGDPDRAVGVAAADALAARHDGRASGRARRAGRRARRAMHDHGEPPAHLAARPGSR